MVLSRLCLLLWVLWATSIQAQSLSPAQYQALETDVEVTHAGEFADALATGNDNVIAAAYSALASPTFWVTRTTLTLREIYEDLSPDNTSWDWNSYIARSVAEKDAWRELFNVRQDRSINPSRPNIPPAIQNIFSGAGGAAQRTHLIAMARRPATRIEQLLATGTGSPASPATLTYEGALSAADVALALRGGE